MRIGIILVFLLLLAFVFEIKTEEPETKSEIVIEEAVVVKPSEKEPKKVYKAETSKTESVVVETATPEVIEEKEPISLGEFKLTAFCHCEKCNGVWAYDKTSSGTVPKQGRTVACDKKVLPAGSKVIINGHEYIVEDTGVKGKHIDIFFDSHKEALKFGVQYAEVFLKED